MYDIAKQEFDEILHTSTKCNLYQYLVPTIYIQTYLTKPIPELYKKYIIKMRLSSHNLAIEQGRYYNVNRNKRNCKFCIDDMEDEMHFILLCPMYTNLRCNLIKPYYWRKPSVFKLLQLFNITNVKQLCNLGKYICRALKLRADTVAFTFLNCIFN